MSETTDTAATDRAWWSLDADRLLLKDRNIGPTLRKCVLELLELSE